MRFTISSTKCLWYVVLPELSSTGQPAMVEAVDREAVSISNYILYYLVTKWNILLMYFIVHHYVGWFYIKGILNCFS